MRQHDFIACAASMFTINDEHSVASTVKQSTAMVSVWEAMAHGVTGIRLDVGRASP